MLSNPTSYVYFPYATQSGAQMLDMLIVTAGWAVDALDAGAYTLYDYSQTGMDGEGCNGSIYHIANGAKDEGMPGDLRPRPSLVWGQHGVVNGVSVDEDGVTLLYPEMTYPRMKEGVERFFITDINNPAGAAAAQSTVPVMEDAWGDSIKNDVNAASIQVFNHVPGGSNVLFMDGHVEFIRLNAKFPIKHGPDGVALSEWMGQLMTNKGGWG
jgi:prepilin-type processing-associated H-X9-DG protein